MAKRKTKPVTLPPFAWNTDGDTGTKDAKGRPIRAPLARKAVELTAIEVRTLAENGETVERERVPVWRGKISGAVASLPETDREALAEYAFFVSHVGASSGASDPTSGGGGSRPTPTGPSLSRIEAAQALGRVHDALKGREIQAHPRGRALSFRRLIELLAVDEVSPTVIARKLDLKPKERPSRPAFAAVKGAIPIASAIVAAALGHRSDIRLD
ncbi:hypothetical protein KX928_17515 [Roseobacter sp. YSTF-M11]|uniref:Uncharacterized protein n=1 Tax=Roseobacter insulae TaxID=2859783 RepID=A0A9X1K3I0_9RHOB|nr:hypothetical protein [Roseobacter insulae]MBW4709588.1 hypothetical protein [Roseobacter insulae]